MWVSISQLQATWRFSGSLSEAKTTWPPSSRRQSSVCPLEKVVRFGGSTPYRPPMLGFDRATVFGGGDDDAL